MRAPVSYALLAIDKGNATAAGESAFTVDGLSVATFRAMAFAEAFADASASASTTCGQANCSVAAEIVAEAFTSIFAEAVAVAEINLDQDSPELSIEVFSQNVTNVTAEVVAIVRLLSAHLTRHRSKRAHLQCLMTTYGHAGSTSAARSWPSSWSRSVMLLHQHCSHDTLPQYHDTQHVTKNSWAS